MRISDWRSDVCSSDLVDVAVHAIRVTDDDAEVLRVATDVEFLDILAEGAGDRDFIAIPATDRDGAGHVVDDQLAGGGQRSRLIDPGLLARPAWRRHARSEEHTSELQSLMRISYAVFCLKKKTTHKKY